MFGFLQFEPEVEEAEGGKDTEAEGETPGCAEMVFGEDEDENHGDKGGQYEADVDLDVGEHDEPAVAVAFF